MSKCPTLTPKVRKTLLGEFAKSISYQFEHNAIDVRMTFDEYVGLWSAQRLSTLQRKVDEGPRAVRQYLRTYERRPVLGWRKREDRQAGGLMTADMARIISADESLRMFRFRAGDTHSQDARDRIGDAKRGKPQSDDHVRLRISRRAETMARKKAERETKR